MRSHLCSVKDSSKTSGDTASQQADFVEGCLLGDLGYADFMHYCVLCKGGSSHLHIYMNREEQPREPQYSDMHQMCSLGFVNCNDT